MMGMIALFVYVPGPIIGVTFPCDHSSEPN
jgi:hypothetical protein